MRMGIVGCLVAIGACSSGNEACLNYAEVYEGCAQEARDAGLPFDVDTSDAKGFCEQLGEQFTEAQWDCQSQAYADVDCATDQGLADALVAVEACEA